jgi:hypothetical protein
MAFPNVKYTGTTPGADSSDYTLVNSITGGWPGNWPACFGVFKVVIDIKHDQAGTLKWYKNMGDVDSTGWVQMGQLAVSAPAATAGTQAEVFVEAQRHVKVIWTNGGTAQSPFSVNIALSDQRAQI